MQQTVDCGVLTYTMHPYVIGRGHRMLAFEDPVRNRRRPGNLMTMEDAAAKARTRYLGSGTEAVATHAVHFTAGEFALAACSARQRVIPHSQGRLETERQSISST